MSEYIKKEDLFNKTIKRNSIWNGTTNAEGKGLEEIVNDLPTYSIPDLSINEEWITWLVGRSVSYRILLSKIEKIRAEIAEIPNKYPMTADYENGIREALSIIDKHIGKGDKEKC